MDLEALVRDYGYLALFIGTFLEGETILVIGGFAAAAQLLDLRLVIVMAFCGSLLGDQMAFFIGRRFGRGILERRPTWQARVQHVHDLLHRWNTPLILVFRFLYGLRNIIPFAIGTTSISARRFIILNIIGAAVWAVALAVGGYFLGAALEQALGSIAHVARWVIAGLVVFSLGYWGVRFLLKRRRKHAQAAGSVPERPDVPGDLP